MKFVKGSKHTEETKAKMRLAKIGRVITPEWKQHMKDAIKRRKLRDGYINSPQARKKVSEYAKTRVRSISERRKISESHRGEKHFRWKGGDMRYLKDLVKQRDNFTCQRCGIDDKEVLEVDHIMPVAIRPDLNRSIDNMVTLCSNCHRRKSNRDIAKIYQFRHANDVK